MLRIVGDGWAAAACRGSWRNGHRLRRRLGADRGTNFRYGLSRSIPCRIHSAGRGRWRTTPFLLAFQTEAPGYILLVLCLPRSGGRLTTVSLASLLWDIARQRRLTVSEWRLALIDKPKVA